MNYGGHFHQLNCTDLNSPIWITETFESKFFVQLVEPYGAEAVVKRFAVILFRVLFKAATDQRSLKFKQTF